MKIWGSFVPCNMPWLLLPTGLQALAEMDKAAERGDRHLISPPEPRYNAGAPNSLLGIDVS